jgi:homoserine kinase
VTSGSWTSFFAPATVSNVGPGYDCFGFALEAPGDTVHVRLADEPGVRIDAIEGGAGLPTDPAANTASVAAARVWARAANGDPRGIEMRIEKGLPPGSGLGSSGASAAAGAAAAMDLAVRALGATADDDLVLDAALAGEAVATGAPHADNVAPALRGGFTIVLATDDAPSDAASGTPHVTRFMPALDLRVAVVTPRLEVSTRAARALMPREIPLADAVAHWSGTATLVCGLMTGDADLVRRALIDRVAAPRRAALIPGCAAAQAAALEAGALGSSISGSGPTMFALATDDAVAEAAAAAMGRVFAAEGLDSTAVVSAIAQHGARRR